MFHLGGLGAVPGTPPPTPHATPMQGWRCWYLSGCYLPGSCLEQDGGVLGGGLGSTVSCGGLFFLELFHQVLHR